MPLSPVTNDINNLIQAARADAPEATVTSMREGFAQLMQLAGSKTTTCEVTPIDVAGFASLLFTPHDARDGLLVWFHGGGWVIGDPSLTMGEVDRLASAARCRAISVGYRLAPEHPFPQPQLDGIAAAEWAIEHAGELGCDPTKVAVGGDSAGGNLAAVAAQHVGGLRAQLLVYPACDLTDEGYATHEHTTGYLLDEDSMAFFVANAVGDAEVADPLISPIRASDEVLATTPAAYVVTAEYDPIRADGARYAERLRHAGVHVEAAHFHEEMHGFFSMPEVLEDARIAIAGAAAFLEVQFADS